MKTQNYNKISLEHDSVFYSISFHLVPSLHRHENLQGCVYTVAANMT